eukprot:gene19439-26097_t
MMRRHAMLGGGVRMQQRRAPACVQRCRFQVPIVRTRLAAQPKDSSGSKLAGHAQDIFLPLVLGSTLFLSDAQGAKAQDYVPLINTGFLLEHYSGMRAANQLVYPRPVINTEEIRTQNQDASRPSLAQVDSTDVTTRLQQYKAILSNSSSRSEQMARFDAVTTAAEQQAASGTVEQALPQKPEAAPIKSNANLYQGPSTLTPYVNSAEEYLSHFFDSVTHPKSLYPLNPTESAKPAEGTNRAQEPAPAKPVVILSQEASAPAPYLKSAGDSVSHFFDSVTHPKSLYPLNPTESVKPAEGTTRAKEPAPSKPVVILSQEASAPAPYLKSAGDSVSHFFDSVTHPKSLYPLNPPEQAKPTEGTSQAQNPAPAPTKPAAVQSKQPSPVAPYLTSAGDSVSHFFNSVTHPQTLYPLNYSQRMSPAAATAQAQEPAAATAQVQEPAAATTQAQEPAAMSTAQSIQDTMSTTTNVMRVAEEQEGTAQASAATTIQEAPMPDTINTTRALDNSEQTVMAAEAQEPADPLQDMLSTTLNTVLALTDSEEAVKATQVGEPADSLQDMLSTPMYAVTAPKDTEESAIAAKAQEPADSLQDMLSTPMYSVTAPEDTEEAVIVAKAQEPAQPFQDMLSTPMYAVTALEDTEDSVTTAKAEEPAGSFQAVLSTAMNVVSTLDEQTPATAPAAPVPTQDVLSTVMESAEAPISAFTTPAPAQDAPISAFTSPAPTQDAPISAFTTPTPTQEATTSAFAPPTPVPTQDALPTVMEFAEAPIGAFTTPTLAPTQDLLSTVVDATQRDMQQQQQAGDSSTRSSAFTTPAPALTQDASAFIPPHSFQDLLSTVMESAKAPISALTGSADGVTPEDAFMQKLFSSYPMIASQHASLPSFKADASFTANTYKSAIPIGATASVLAAVWLLGALPNLKDFEESIEEARARDPEGYFAKLDQAIDNALVLHARIDEVVESQSLLGTMEEREADKSDDFPGPSPQRWGP